MVRAFVFACAAAAAVVSVDAHTNMAVPAVKFPDGFYNGNSPMGRIQQDNFPAANAEGLYFNTQKIVKVLEGYKSLRELVVKNVNLTTFAGLTNTKECGLTITTGEKQPIPDAVDFPWGHPGPCEVWCDNTRIFYNDECQANNVGKIPIDKTKCAGVSIIQAMYVGVHVNPWEVYTNCAPMVGGTKVDFETDLDPSASAGSAGGKASGSDDTGNDASTPAATTKAPAATTKAPSTATTAPATTTKAPATPAATTKAPATPAATTKAPTPAASPSTPSTTKTNCKRRVRN